MRLRLIGRGWAGTRIDLASSWLHRTLKAPVGVVISPTSIVHVSIAIAFGQSGPAMTRSIAYRSYGLRSRPTPQLRSLASVSPIRSGVRQLNVLQGRPSPWTTLAWTADGIEHHGRDLQGKTHLPRPPRFASHITITPYLRHTCQLYHILFLGNTAGKSCSHRISHPTPDVAVGSMPPRSPSRYRSMMRL